MSVCDAAAASAVAAVVLVVVVVVAAGDLNATNAFIFLMHVYFDIISVTLPSLRLLDYHCN